MRVFEHSAMDQDIIILEFQDSKILMTVLVFLLSCDLKTQPWKNRHFSRMLRKVHEKYFFYENDGKLCFETKSTKLFSKMLLVKSSDDNFIFLPVFYLIMWLESFKEFWKNSHFENMRADFLCRISEHSVWQSREY